MTPLPPLFDAPRRSWFLAGAGLVLAAAVGIGALVVDRRLADAELRHRADAAQHLVDQRALAEAREQLAIAKRDGALVLEKLDAIQRYEEARRLTEPACPQVERGEFLEELR